jgi:hypothetical protein
MPFAGTERMESRGRRGLVTGFWATTAREEPGMGDGWSRSRYSTSTYWTGSSCGTRVAATVRVKYPVESCHQLSHHCTSTVRVLYNYSTV